jgi:hypothetical protein
VSDAAGPFAFVQFDFAGPLGLEEGRYVVRGGDEGVERILVVADAQAPAHLPRRSPRRARARKADLAPPPPPVRRLTVIEPGGLGSNEAAGGWLQAARDEKAGEALVAEALAVVNRALHAGALAAFDPHPRELGVGAALAIRVGYGDGEDVAEGRWREALDLPGPGARHARRADALRSDERFAAILGGRVSPGPAETLLFRARADRDAGREREFALQLRPALAALVADLPPGEERDALEARGERASKAADRALTRGLDATTVDELTETLSLCERVLRRRAVGRE